MNIYEFVSNFNSICCFEFTTLIMQIKIDNSQIGGKPQTKLNIIPTITSPLKYDDLGYDDKLVYNLAKNNIIFSIQYYKNDDETKIKKIWITTNEIANENNLKYIIPLISKITNFFGITKFEISYDYKQYEFCIIEK